MKSKSRLVGLDLVKLIACCLVVSAHTVKAEIGIVSFVVVAIATTAIPLFFTVNGYLMFQKKIVATSYILKKIVKILLVCFAWEALHGIVYFLYYREFRNFVLSFVLDFFQQGLFFHFWFMGALILLYCLFPLLHWFYQKHEKIFLGLLIGIGVICIVCDVLMRITGERFILNIPQNLRLWYWLFYYILGGFLAKNKDKIQKKVHSYSKYRCFWILSVFLLLSVCWQYIFGCVMEEHCIIESFYGCLPVMLLVATVMIFAANLQNLKGKKQICYCASLTMGLYIVHPFLLAVLEKFVPAFTSGSIVMNLLFWILTVIVSGIVSAIIRCIPIVKEMIKL